MYGSEWSERNNFLTCAMNYTYDENKWNIRLCKCALDCGTIRKCYLLFILLTTLFSRSLDHWAGVHQCKPINDCENGSVYIPNASMPGGLPIVRGLSPGVVLVPGVGASFLGVGVLDFRLGVDDLSFWNRETFLNLWVQLWEYAKLQLVVKGHKTVTRTKMKPGPSQGL